MGLAARNLGGREDVRREQSLVIRDAQCEAQPCRRARRSDADARVRAAGPPAGRLRRLSVPVRRSARISRDSVAAKSFGSGAPSSVSIRFEHRILAHAEEALARLVVAEAQAGLCQHAARDGERDRFAVDQHAVAVEDDDFRPARPPASPCGPRVRPASRIVERAALAGMKRGDRAARRLGSARQAPTSTPWRSAGSPFRPRQRRSSPSPAAPASPVSGVDTVLPQASAMIWRTRRALRRAAADDDRLEVVARPLERADDVGDPVSEAAKAGDIELIEACRVLPQIQSDDPAARRRRRRRARGRR